MKIQNSDKTARQKVVAIVTLNLMEKYLLCQFCYAKFDGFNSPIKQVIKVQSPCGRNPPLPSRSG